MLSFDQLQNKVSKPMGIIRQPRAKRGVIMKEFSKIMRAFGEWLKPNETACMFGCTFCCYGMPVLKSKLEFELVQSAVKFHFVQTEPWLRKHGRKWDKFAGILGPTNRVTLNAWRGMKIPCPMLREDDRACGIYESRPIVCRMRWTPEFFLSDCFPGTPIFPMLDGPAQASAFEISDPFIPRSNPRVEPPFLKLVENTLKDIDKWVYNYVGKPKPLIDAVKPETLIVT